MGTLLDFVFGLALGTLGFVVMRNPMRLSLLSPGAEGYYQRLILDALQRNQIRVVGALVSLFGSSMFVDALATLLKSPSLATIGKALWALMWLLFVCTFLAGIIIAIKQTMRGELLDWMRMWRTGSELGPVNVFPAVTPRMETEARIFTLVLCFLVGITVIAALLR